MRKTKNEVITCLLDDDDFINDIKLQVNKIMADDKLDISDLVPIVTLVIEIIKNRKVIFDIDKKDISEVFRCLLLSIFERLEVYNKIKNKTGLEDEIIKKKVDLIIENLLTILISKIKTISFLKKIIKFKFC
mgnify:CR=1 FL=1